MNGEYPNAPFPLPTSLVGPDQIGPARPKWSIPIKMVDIFFLCGVVRNNAPLLDAIDFSSTKMVQPDQNGRKKFLVRFRRNKVPALLPPSDWLCPCKKNAIDFLPTILVEPDQNVWGFFFSSKRFSSMFQAFKNNRSNTTTHDIRRSHGVRQGRPVMRVLDTRSAQEMLWWYLSGNVLCTRRRW